ncbi:MAG: hypothetical protein M1821_005654 [Bathelium mastoideum]|nr:MAG: hypothetical protein M1821_005654 [Bathelium mastoideum]
MKFSTSMIFLAFGLMAAASPLLEEHHPEAVAEPETIAPDADLATTPVPEEINTITQPGCKKDVYRCVGVQGVCTQCAIAIGIGDKVCKLNNRCGGTNTCQVANGQPYCV